ncbi:MAG: hypothetical protein QGG79_03835 [Dehalococcoidales bacterium]|jgi:hypothetical protein|nr:hypothetical protein [Dehalococcoidales bacterium]MDP7286266.1 hypothetical protein [Dehalococcoidales bacterium]|tara:strand:- start:76 stop:294 length:219 start_codon:yes stop_codon:yes gene_type:complete
MGHKIREVPEKPAVKKECWHYWIIEEARGTTSRGVCKFCGADEEFYNSWPDATYAGREGPVPEAPEQYRGTS